MGDSNTVTIDWTKASGDIWAQRWRDTDRGLEPLQSHLVSAVVDHAPSGPFHAFDIGCGPGSTTIAVANALADASIIACDISPALAEVARQRTADRSAIRVVIGDAEEIAAAERPFDLFFSRHGVMFFADPVRAFGTFRAAAKPRAALIFSCFQAWELNPWASELASGAAGRRLPPPGKGPGGFAFSDPDYVLDILRASGWPDAQPQSVHFDYVAGEGEQAVDDALSFMTEIGPASRTLESLPEEAKGDAVQRMRGVIERYFDGTAVVFPAAAWIWSATAA